MDLQILFLFVLTISLEILYLILFLLTLRLPGFRFWPPPGPRSWQFFTAWFIAGFVAVNFLLLGLLDFDSAFLPSLLDRLPFVLLFAIPGTTLGTWSSFQFGLGNTIGLGKSLVTGGPYRYTRNPQYLGDGLNILAFMVLTNSWMAWVVGALGITLNLLAPFTEEPWLEQRFGEAYREYKNCVPRFLG
jgi:protein-S-isoprenylcysteine O-methyltransferase Ste14